MKPNKLLLAMAITSCIIAFTSCKKTADTSREEIATTVELSSDQAVSDNLTEDANDIYMEAATEANLTGETAGTPNITMGNIRCATVTVTPLVGFPKNIVIDFGTGCTSPFGVTRKGKIKITLSDSLRKFGSSSVITFDGYFVNGFKKEGTITWTNNSNGAIKGWQRKVENGKITAPGGRFWLHTALKNVVQTAGYTTPRNLPDDVFSITGSSSVTNANRITRTSTILTALEKKTNCGNITKGTISMQGPNHTAVLDFGNGDCDNLATITVNGGTPKQIFLR